MPFTLIRGIFHVVGRRPDGDTLSFQPDDKKSFDPLSGPKPRFNMSGNGNITSLRFEAIDTLETHYRPRGRNPELHQPAPYADSATDFALNAAGIKNVVWGERDGKRTRVLSADDQTEGYILARAVERFGRVVAFLFSGPTNKPDGSSQFLDVTWLKQSINFKLITAGLAYPTYYEDMCRFIDLRDALTDAAIAAYNADKGLWSVDATSGLAVNNEQQLVDDAVLLPKLFRRLTEYLRTTNNKVKGFKAWLKARREDVLVLAPDMMGKMTTFDDVVFEKGKTVGLTTDPENVIFKP